MTTYTDKYLDAAATNPELRTAADDKPIELQIDRAQLKRIQGQIWQQYHPNDTQ